MSSEMHHTKSRTSSDDVTEPSLPRPFTVHFLDKNKEASAARAAYLKILIGGSFLVSLAIFGIFSIYWGALWKTPVRNLEGWIVDFDGGQIGQTVTQNFASIPSIKVSWQMRPASDFPNGVADLSAAVVEERCWTAIAINSGATARLNAAVVAANASYDGSSAITAFGVEARNENAYRNLIRPSIEVPLQVIAHNFALQFAKQLSTQSNFTTLVSGAPQVLIQPFYYTIHNIRPFDSPVATAVTFVGLIYLLILSFFVVMISNGARDAAGYDRSLTLGSLLRVRMISAIGVYLFLSLFYTLLSRAFNLPFDRKFGQGGLVVFWMLSWFGMMSVGLALEAMFTLFTIRFVPFFMILWIIANVSVCFLPLEVLPIIYHYGYAAPFYNVSRGVRTIVFGTKNTIGLNFGVLFAWIVISCITLPLIQWFRRRGDINEWRRREMAEKTEM